MKLAVNTLKSILKLPVCFASSLFVKKTPIIPKTLLLIRLDGFGDYILFRNFLYWLRNSSQYKGYRITLVGNIVWQEFVQCFDADIADEFIWLNRRSFNRSLNYRINKIKEICKHGYEVLLYPTYLRETLYGDSIAHAVSASHKICSVGDCNYRHAIENYCTKGIYTKLISAELGVIFEFNRIREFFLGLTNQDLSNVKLELTTLTKPQFNFSYIVLFIGASNRIRKWPLSNFIELGKQLHERYQVKVLFCGDRDDLSEMSRCESKFDDTYMVNMVGVTSQLELITILSGAKFVVSNETVTPHLCIALNVEVFVIYNGNNFGRFTPYPISITDKYHVINHPTIDKDPGWYMKISNQNVYSTKLAINDISVDQVLSTILYNQV